MRGARMMPLVLGLTSLWLAGCGGSAGPGGPEGAGSSAGGGKTRIVYWVTPEIKDVAGQEEQTREYGDYEKLQAAEYMKAHPDVEIEVQSLASEELTKKVGTAIASGTQPDLLKDFLGRTAGYARRGLLEDFKPVLPKEDYEDYDPFYRELYTIDGQFHGLPIYAWTVAVFMNRALWEAEGKADLLPDLDKGSWTYDEFLTAMRAVAKPDKVWPWWAQFASEQADYCNYGFFWGKGAFLYTPGDYSRATINTPKGVEALDFLIKMEREKLIPPGSTTMARSELENMVGQGQTAAWGDSLYAFQWVDSAQKQGRVKVPLKLQVAQFPHEPGKKSPMPVGPTAFVVFKQKDEAKRKAVMDFARWLNTPEFQKVYSLNARQFPTRKSTGNPLEADENLKRVKRWMDENGMVDLGLTAPGYYEVRVATMPHLQAAILGSKTPAAALKDIETEANTILKRN